MNSSTAKPYQYIPFQSSSRFISKTLKQQSTTFMSSQGAKSKKQVELGNSRYIKDDQIENGLVNFPKHDLKIERVDSGYYSKRVERESRRADVSVEHKDRLTNRSRERMTGSGIGRPYVRGIQSQSLVSDGVQSEQKKSGVYKSSREVFEDSADSRSGRNRLSMNGKYTTYRRQSQGLSPSYLKTSPRGSSKNLNGSLGENIDHSSGYHVSVFPKMISSVVSENTEVVTSGMSVKNRAYLKPFIHAKSLDSQQEEVRTKGTEIAEQSSNKYESQILQLQKQNRNQNQIIKRLQIQLSSFKSNFMNWEKENVAKEKQIQHSKVLIEDLRSKEKVERVKKEQIQRLETKLKEESRKKQKQWDRKLEQQKQIQEEEFQIRLQQQRNKVESMMKKQFDIKMQETVTAKSNQLLMAVQKKQQQIDRLNQQIVKQTVNSQSLSKIKEELSSSKDTIQKLTKALHSKQTNILSLTLSLQNAEKNLVETQSKNCSQKQEEKGESQYQKLIVQYQKQKRILDEDRREVTRLYIEVEKEKKQTERINALYKEGQIKLAQCQVKLLQNEKNLADGVRLEEEREKLIKKNLILKRENQSLQRVHQRMNKMQQDNTFLKQQNLELAEQKQQYNRQKYESLQNEYSILLQKLQIKQAEIVHKQEDYKKLKMLYQEKVENGKNLERGTLRKIQDLQTRLIETESRLKGLLIKIQGEEDMMGGIISRMEDGWEGYEMALGKLQTENEVLFTKYMKAKKGIKKQGKKDECAQVEQERHGMDNWSYLQFLQKEIWSYFNRIAIPGFEAKIKNKIGEIESKMVEKNKKIQQIRYRLKERKNKQNHQRN